MLGVKQKFLIIDNAIHSLKMIKCCNSLHFTVLMCTQVEINHAIFCCCCSLVVITTTRCKEMIQEWHIYSCRIIRGASTAASHIWTFPLHVPDQYVWESAHHSCHHLRLPPPHTHVLPPLQPVLCRHLFHLHHHPKDAGEHTDTEQSHLL